MVQSLPSRNLLKYPYRLNTESKKIFRNLYPLRGERAIYDRNKKSNNRNSSRGGQRVYWVNKFESVLVLQDLGFFGKKQKI